MFVYLFLLLLLLLSHTRRLLERVRDAREIFDGLGWLRPLLQLQLQLLNVAVAVAGTRRQWNAKMHTRCNCTLHTVHD